MGATSMSTVTIYVSSEGNMFAAVADAFKTWKNHHCGEPLQMTFWLKVNK